MTSLKEFIEAGVGKADIIHLHLLTVDKRLIGKGSLLKKTGLIILIGMIYGVFISFTGISIPCPIRYFTGFLCPGCGITTLFLSLVHGDWHSAKQANVFLFYTLPLFFLSMVIVVFWPNSQVARLNKKYFMPLYLAALVVFGFYRNI